MNEPSPTASRLVDIADVRCGDKGNTSIVAVHPRSGTDPARLRRLLDPAAIARHFGLPPEKVIVREPTRLGTIVIVLQDRLYGGVTRSTSTDPHGKSFSYHLLEMELP